MADSQTVADLPVPMSADFNGLERAAMLLLIAGNDHARFIIDKLDMDEIKSVTQKMSSLGRITSIEIEQILRDFMKAMGAGAGVVGSYNTTKQFLEKVLDEENASLVMKDIGGPPGRDIWMKLANIDEPILAEYLKSEYPQTIAVILSKLRTDKAARVMTHLPKETTFEAITRMLQLESVQEEILTDVEDALRAEFSSKDPSKKTKDQHEVLAEIFNNFDRSSEETFLGMLEEKNKDSAEIIRSLMFTFDDMIKFDGSTIQIVLRNIDNTKLGLALKGVKDELRDLFLKNMSERAAKILREDMETMGPVRIRDVEEAQSGIIVAAKKLLDSGEISLPSEGDDEDMVS